MSILRKIPTDMKPACASSAANFQFPPFLAALAGAVILLAMAMGAANAQKITPSIVYQSVDNISRELARMHQANISRPKVDASAPALTPRKPRHVIQKAREVMVKVQTLRWINNLPRKPVPPIPARKITPGDVLKMTNEILAEVRELRSKFGIVQAPQLAPSPGKKSPTDVYSQLLVVSLQLDGLGIPGVLPNDVYRAALTIISDVKLIQASSGIDRDMEINFISNAKSPGNVYDHSYKLLAQLKSLAGNAKFAVGGGVVLPNKRAGRITPAHVVDLLNNALAEIGAVKAKLGIAKPTNFAAAQSGKTPSHVFDAVQTAITMVASLG